MYFSIVATGNHFIFDGLIGYTVVLSGLWLSTEWAKRRALAPTSAPSPAYAPAFAGARSETRSLTNR